FDDQRIYTLARTITYKYVDVNGKISNCADCPDTTRQAHGVFEEPMRPCVYAGRKFSAMVYSATCLLCQRTISIMKTTGGITPSLPRALQIRARELPAGGLRFGQPLDGSPDHSESTARGLRHLA